MLFSLAKVGISAACLSLAASLSACNGQVAAEPGLHGSSREQPEVASSSHVDPQVFQDVVESVFMLPGPSQLRAIRVSNFTQDLLFKACGGVGPPLDSTADRFMQQLFPDLELIRERGIVEPDSPAVRPGTKPGCDIVSSGLSRRLPSRENVMDLIQPWLDVVTTTLQDPTLLALKKPMWVCMTSQSSLDVGQDVPGDFLKATNIALSQLGATSTEVKALSRIYADCSDPYFTRLRRLLLPRRPAEIERNRELLERYASELVGLGYLP
ncbi:MAG TPA: hypothetical protein VHO29_11380 [Marmoricola sp.]|nr:hypothetical protein [Marmoricola sp.]